MKARKIITFDIDGVVVDTAGNAVKLFNKRFNQNKKVNDLNGFFIISEWLTDILKDKNLATQETIKIWNDEEVLFKSKPISGVLELLKVLTNKGYEIRFITSRPGFTKLVTLGWFKKWLPWVNEKSIYMSSDANGLQRTFKSETIGKIKPFIHFDDSVEHVSDIVLASPQTQIILVRQPWNYNITSNLPITVFIPEGKEVRRNVLASYRYYLDSGLIH